MRFLAIDHGEKRTGLAVGDDQTLVACPVGVISASSNAEWMRKLGQAIEQHSPGALVLGLPLNMDGTEGRASKRARRLASQLEAHFGLRVHLVDERLTTHLADDQLSHRGLTRQAKRTRRDALAAAAILSDFLESRKTGSAGPG